MTDTLVCLLDDVFESISELVELTTLDLSGTGISSAVMINVQAYV